MAHQEEIKQLQTLMEDCKLQKIDFFHFAFCLIFLFDLQY